MFKRSRCIFVSVLLCMSHIVFGMEQPFRPLGIEELPRPYQAINHPAPVNKAVPLEGKLKPIAVVLERNLERYDEFEQSHPALASAALKGSMVVAKGVLFAGAGALSGATLGTAVGGPVGGVAGAVVMGGEGFMVGMSKGIADEIKASFVRKIAGEQLDALVSRGVDGLAPQFLRLDSSLDERDTKILAGCAIGSMLTSAEFKLVSKGMLRAAGRGLAHPRAVVKRAIKDPRGALYALSRTRILTHSPLTHAAHALPGALVETVEEQVLAQPGQPHAADHDALGQQLAQAQNELGDLLVQTVRENVHHDLETSAQIMRLEKNPDKAVATREIKTHIEAAKTNRSYELSKNTFADAFEGVSAVLSIAGNHKAARQIATFGHAGIKIMDSCHMLATGTSLVGASMAPLALSPLAPFVGIASAVSCLCSLFGDDGGGEATRAICTAIKQMHQALSEQIKVVHAHMIERFDGLENKVDQLDLRLVQGFLGMRQQMQDFSATTRYSFARIESEVQVLHEINAKADVLLLRPLVTSCEAVDSYQDRHGDLKTMEPKAVSSHCEVLENAVRGVDPTYANLNGHACSDFFPLTMNRMLTSAAPEARLGYLAKYMTAVLGQALPRDVDAATLPHLGIFELGLKRYLALRKGTTHIPYDDEGNMLRSIARTGEHALTFVGAIEGNEVLFGKLFDNYQQSLKKVCAVCNQAFERKSLEFLDAVHGNALKINREEIETFPACLTTSGSAYFTGNFAFIAGQHALMKQQLSENLGIVAQNKPRFKVSISDTKALLLANGNHTMLNTIALPSNTTTQEFPKILFDARKKSAIIEHR